eukprot:gene5277-8895_t
MKLLLVAFFTLLAFTLSQESLYLKNIRRVTNVGVSAEAYWSFDDKKIIFQGYRDQQKCDQIYSINVDGTDLKMISNGQGRTTCSYFYPDGEHFVYSSTMNSLGPGCPPEIDRTFGYVWPVYKTMNIYQAKYPSGEITKVLQSSDSYDAEATVSPTKDKIVFTSARDGDLELYSMDLNGTNVKRLTYTPGYDGGAFFSHDGKKIVWRANRPRQEQLTNYLNLLKLGIIEPATLPMELYVMNSDGFNQQKITSNGFANFAPNFFPKDDGVIFSSNLGGSHRAFQLYAVDTEGKKATEQITTEGNFNSFPMFSNDGKYLMFISDRGSSVRYASLDIYIAEWNGVQFKEKKPQSPSKQNDDGTGYLVLVVFGIIFCIVSCIIIQIIFGTVGFILGKKAALNAYTSKQTEMNQFEDEE